MDVQILLQSIMTDPKGSKSNIAAKFQNTLGLHVLPPIGVFWDIENCQVPKGKSAIALVQNIRENFFANHREAEFMCVCDINKESKVVIQELLFAQVTIVHISATSKNAADDKLKQCMKRYVDTHGAPSTLLLISDDVNFASDLSDFRHRHNIRIILIHRGHAHQSLLACAHEHYDFHTIAHDLPLRSPVKPSDNRPCELEVTDLPLHKKESHVRNRLHKLSNNCGGKVVQIRGSRAVIRFANADAAEKAKKRMDKENVFGNKICVNFRPKTDNEGSYSPQQDYNKDSDSYSESSLSSSSSSGRDSSLSPKPTKSDKITNHHCNTQKKFHFPPPPIITEQNSPSLLKQGNLMKDNLVKNLDTSRLCSSVPDSHKGETSKENKSFAMDWNNIQTFCHPNEKYQDISAFSSSKKEQELNNKKCVQRNIGRMSPFFLQDCDIKNTKSFLPLTDSAANRRQLIQNNFSLYSSHGFHAMSQINMPIREIQRINDPVPFAAQWSVPISIETSQSLSRTMPSDVLSAVELHVSNLDPTFEVNEMKKILLSVFSEHVMVLHISMSLQPDGSAKAMVKVPSFQDAQFAISRLHRRKIGHKRILISHVSSEKSPPFHVLKSETIALLNDIPAKNLPLIKFRELYEKRYHRPIAVSDLYKMRDAVTLQEDSGSRTVYLNLDFYKTPSLPDSEDSQDFNAIERPYCERHFHVSDSQGWAEQYSVCPLPLVFITLKVLSTAVHKLLDTHQGSLPLISFCACYEAEVGPLPVVGSVASSSSRDAEDSDGLAAASESSAAKKGVPLEHLIACVTGVEVAKSVLCIKKVQWLENKILESQISQNFSPALVGQLNLFGREVMDLLKSQSQCLVAFNKFIPTYHHHFGRQCRVADYGFTKLIDLLEAIPHIVQVLGEGQNRQVTLTHRTQVKRFAAELLRILKSRASKQILVSEFSQAYEQVIEKPFEITNYGVCDVYDMLEEVPENVILISPGRSNSSALLILLEITKSGTETIVEIPKREQTPEEIERTKQFALEVIELMKHTPDCAMAFNKFIPAYHHHFGKQCRVADYGCTKLVELFEAIPNVLEVSGIGEDKVLYLVQEEQHKILTERLVDVLKSQPNEVIDINQISSAYAVRHGHALRPADFGFADLHELLEKMDSTLRIVIGYGRTYVTLVDQSAVRQISLNLRRLLMEKCEGKMSADDICKDYLSRFGQKINISLLVRDFVNIIVVKGDVVSLTPLQLLARNMILLLQDHGGQILYSMFCSLYQRKYAEPFSSGTLGFSSMNALLQSLSDYFHTTGKKQKRVIVLNAENVGDRLPDFNILNDSVLNNVPPSTLELANEKRCENYAGFESSLIKENVFQSLNFETANTFALKSSPPISLHLPEPPLSVFSHQIKTERSPVAPSGLSNSFDAQSFLLLNAKTAAGSFQELAAAQSLSVIQPYRNAVERIAEALDARGPLSPLRKPAADAREVSESCEDLLEYEKFHASKEKDTRSSKSTPTRSGRRQRNRIAAQFSMNVE